jgi:chaperonin GroEL (HSP60 family)
MQTPKPIKKVSVVLVRSKQVEPTSDINKMAVHLEKLLEENLSVDLKSRNTVTDANIKSSDFVVFCGFNLDNLSSLFQALSVIELTEAPIKTPIIFLYDEPGQSIYEDLNRILMRGMDLKRVNPKIFKSLVDTWRHHDIIAMVNQEIKIRENEPSAEPDGPSLPGKTES